MAIFSFVESRSRLEVQECSNDYIRRAQQLRRLVFGAFNGLVSTGSVMASFGFNKKDTEAMFYAGFATLLAGTITMAVAEFISVHGQRDVEICHIKRDSQGDRESEDQYEKQANPLKNAFTLAYGYSVGAVLPLIAALITSWNHKIRLGVVAAIVSLTLLIPGVVGIVLEKPHIFKSSVRILIGGWIVMVVTFIHTAYLDTLNRRYH